MLNIIIFGIPKKIAAIQLKILQDRCVEGLGLIEVIKEKIKKNEINFFFQSSRSISEERKNVIILVSGFYTQWLSEDWPSDQLKAKIIESLKKTVTNYLDQLESNIRVQCSILSETLVVQ